MDDHDDTPNEVAAQPDRIGPFASAYGLATIAYGSDRGRAWRDSYEEIDVAEDGDG